MTTKTCSICYETKSCDDFHKRKDSKDGYRGDCKVCTKKRINKYRSVNKEKVNKWNKETYYRNIEKHKETKKKWRCDNREKHEELKKNWKNNNPKYHIYYHKIKTINDSKYRLVKSLRARFRNLLLSKSTEKHSNTILIIGCDLEFLKKYIENQFKEGMSWDNYGFYGWHIDHIIPLSSAENYNEMCSLFHYTNLQPLWAHENLKKSNKYGTEQLTNY